MKRTIIIILVLLLQHLASNAESNVSFYVYAHPDDWQLFMGVDAYKDISEPSQKVVLIQLGAGEGSMGTGGKTTFNGKTYLPYYLARLSGSKKAVEFCADTKTPYSTWSHSIMEICGHKIMVEVYKNVIMYTLLLSDTDDIHLLFNKSEEARAIDSSTSYKNKDDIIKTIRAIFRKESNVYTNKTLHITDPDITGHNTGDHRDHNATAKFAVIANIGDENERGTLMPTYAYLTYRTESLPVNLTLEQLTIKGALLGLTDWGRTENNFESTMKGPKDSHVKWACRQYKRRLDSLNYSKTYPETNQAAQAIWYLSDDETEQSKTDIIVQPEPSGSFVNILYRIRLAGTAHIEIYNAAGQPVTNILNDYREMGNHVIRYDTQSLPPGTYVIKIKTLSMESEFSFARK